MPNPNVKTNSLKKWLQQAISDEHINLFDQDKFTYLGEISKGGYGIVRKYMWKQCKLPVALKCLKDDRIVNDFIKELQTLQKVSFHPNIIQFYGVTKDPETGFNMVLQYASGGDLRDYLKKNFSSLSWADKLRIAEEITLGLMFLHKNKIIHRDLHSKNILVHEKRMMISDFGLSKQLRDVSSGQISSVNGVPAYIDPQCFKDILYQRNEKSDIYSLGVILWEISSGKPPYGSITFGETLVIQIYTGLRETPVKGTPSQYVDLFERCWDENPNERPNAESVLQNLNMIKNPKINSTLITVEDSREIICQIDPSLNNIDTFIIPDKLKLLLKGKADGFGRDIFFKKLKNIERTILILRIKDSPEIIGGYNPLKWKKLGSFNSTDCCYSETCASFIFSLKRGNLENSIFSKIAFSKHAIYREKGLGPCFSLDLFMASDKKGKTWGCFKSDYECKIRDLDGWFQIEDYEVFQYL